MIPVYITGWSIQSIDTNISVEKLVLSDGIDNKERQAVSW
jgi:hypothetical protein